MYRSLIDFYDTLVWQPLKREAANVQKTSPGRVLPTAREVSAIFQTFSTGCWGLFPNKECCSKSKESGPKHKCCNKKGHSGNER
jgi:hypothetical protein